MTHLREGDQYEVYIVVNHHSKHGEDDEQREGTAYRVLANGRETPHEVVANCLRGFADELDPRGHEHIWDTESEEFSTFTPDPALDQPWVIHECIEVGCLAIKVTRVLRDRPLEIVYEGAEILHSSDCATHSEPAFPSGPCNCGATS